MEKMLWGAEAVRSVCERTMMLQGQTRAVIVVARRRFALLQFSSDGGGGGGGRRRIRSGKRVTTTTRSNAGNINVKSDEREDDERVENEEEQRMEVRMEGRRVEFEKVDADDGFEVVQAPAEDDIVLDSCLVHACNDEVIVVANDTWLVVYDRISKLMLSRCMIGFIAKDVSLAKGGLIAVSGGNGVYIYVLGSNGRLAIEPNWTLHQSYPASFSQFSPSGEYLGVAMLGGEVAIWKPTANSAPVRSTAFSETGLTQMISSFCFSPSSLYLLVASHGGSLIVYKNLKGLEWELHFRYLVNDKDNAEFLLTPCHASWMQRSDTGEEFVVFPAFALDCIAFLKVSQDDTRIVKYLSVSDTALRNDISIGEYRWISMLDDNTLIAVSGKTMYFYTLSTRSVLPYILLDSDRIRVSDGDNEGDDPSDDRKGGNILFVFGLRDYFIHDDLVIVAADAAIKVFDRVTSVELCCYDVGGAGIASLWAGGRGTGNAVDRDEEISFLSSMKSSAKINRYSYHRGERRIVLHRPPNG